MRARITNISGVTLTLPYIYRGLPIENGQSFVVLGPASRAIANLGGEKFMTGIYQVDDVLPTATLDIEEAVDLPVTEDINYYVSPSGDDANDGLTPATAVKTISVAAAKIPMNIAADVIINLAPGEYSSYLYEARNFIASRADSRATLQFIGSFKDYTPTSGVASGTFDASFTGQSLPSIAVLTGAGWVANELRGKFLSILSGPRAGFEYPIVENTSDTIMLSRVVDSGFFDLRNVQFKIVEPAVTWTNPDTTGTAYTAHLSGTCFAETELSSSTKGNSAGYYFFGIAFTSRHRIIMPANNIRMQSCSFNSQGLGSGFGYIFRVTTGTLGLTECYLNAPTTSNFVLPISFNTGGSAFVYLAGCTIRGGQIAVGVLGAKFSVINCVFENQTSTGWNATFSYIVVGSFSLVRNQVTGFRQNGGNYLAATNANMYFQSCSTAMVLYGNGYSAIGLPASLSLDGGNVGIEIWGDYTSWKSGNTLTIKNFTQWGVRISGTTIANAPMYSGFMLDTTKTTMTGNTLGDFTLDGVTPIALADVAAAPNKLIIDTRGRGTFVRGL